MSATIETLTPSQLAAVYNHHADTPVKKFENRQKGARRLIALLAKIEVDPADAIAAVIPDATQEGEKIDMAPDAPADAPQATLYTAEDTLAFLAARNAPEGHIGYGDKIEDDERLAAAERANALDAAWQAGYRAGQADAAAAKKAARAAKAPRAAAPRTARTETTGNARALIIAACSRPEGATSVELHATTGWNYASWSHQLKLITTKTGTPHEIRKIDGTTRYFLLTGRA